MNQRLRLVRIDGRPVDLDRAPILPFAAPTSSPPLPADIALALGRIGYRTLPVADAAINPDDLWDGGAA